MELKENNPNNIKSFVFIILFLYLYFRISNSGQIYKKRNEINVRNFDENGNFVDERNYKYQYDEKGNWVERIEYVNDFPKVLIEREFIYYK